MVVVQINVLKLLLFLHPQSAEKRRVTQNKSERQPTLSYCCVDLMLAQKESTFRRFEAIILQINDMFGQILRTKRYLQTVM